MTELVTPSERYRASYLAAVAETGASMTEVEFASLLASHADFASGHNLKPTRVRQTTLWLVDGDDYIGRISIRHALTPLLGVIGGHVGYDVRPSRRRQGHATRMLEAAKPRMVALGVDPALITCDETNVGSRKVIEACGGQLATEAVDMAAARAIAETQGPESLAMLEVPQLRFWLRTSG